MARKGFRNLAIVVSVALASCLSVASAQSFKRIQLSRELISEAVAVEDIDRDGHPDIVAGAYWYKGPNFKIRKNFRDDGCDDCFNYTYDPHDGRPPDHIVYSSTFNLFTYDFNDDGWPDILSLNVPGREATWFENPGRAGLRQGVPWKQHLAFDVVGNESPTFCRLHAGARPVLIFMRDREVGFAAPDWNHPDLKWQFHSISREGDIPDSPYVHGLGCGDVNGDGRVDIMGPQGWWEQPQLSSDDVAWRFHRWSFLKERPQPAAGSPSTRDKSHYLWPYSLSGAQIYAYDVNGDGLQDIVSSLDAHHYGLAWFEQMKPENGDASPRFQTHLVMDPNGSTRPSFSQLHALALADMDGDGLKDIVTGKRFQAHGRYVDADPDGDAVLYWFKLNRSSQGRATFQPRLVDRNSGVGTQIAVADLNGDGRPDIIVSNKKGLFVFLQTTKK